MKIINVIQGMLLLLLLVTFDAQTPIIPQSEQTTSQTIKQLQFVEKYHVEPTRARQIVDVVQEYSEKFKIDSSELLALIAIESSFRQYVVSGSGAMGYVQHIDRWHPEKVAYITKVLGYYDQFELRSNLMMGVLISAEYKRRYGSRWLQAYNGSLKDKHMIYTNKFNVTLKELNA